MALSSCCSSGEATQTKHCSRLLISPHLVGRRIQVRPYGKPLKFLGEKLAGLQGISRARALEWFRHPRVGGLHWLGCFFHSGANNNALVKTIVGNAYGALVAWVALLIIVKVPVPGLGAVWPAIVVGATVFLLVIVASIDLLPVVPANVYGYAALVAYSLHQASAAPATGPLQNLVSPSFANPLVLLIVSMVIGALFGYASDQLAKVLPIKQLTMAAHA